MTESNTEKPVYIDMETLDVLTAHLTPEETGIHFQLLCLCWKSPGREIPDNPTLIIEGMKSDEARVSGFYEAKILPILEEFFDLTRGHWIEKLEIAI